MRRSIFATIAVAAFLGGCGGPGRSGSTLPAQNAPRAVQNVAVGAMPWTETIPFTTGRVSHQSVRIDDRAYVFGGYSYDPVLQQLNLYDDVQVARLLPSGGIAPSGWRTTTPFKTARLGHSSAAYRDRIYLVAGGDGFTYFDDVQYARTNEDGTIAPDGWTTSPHHLNVPRAVQSSVVYRIDGRAYLYAVGGVGDVNGNTVHFNTVEYARLADDGGVGPWTLSPMTFDRGRSSPATAIVNGCLYVVGGWGDAFTDIFADVQYSCLNSDGSLNPWKKSPNAMHVGRYGHTMIVVPHDDARAAELIVFGGNAGGGVYLNEIERSSTSGPGGNSPWVVLPAQDFFPNPRWGHTTVDYRGTVYILGGVTRSQQYLNEVIDAPIERFSGP
ncbi:MAG TPA: hypothetical protein VGU66_20995 [Candidatus Elarobacter sp.]|nr:hypothetical protein [Candidatus Elarobacter sp.]